MSAVEPDSKNNAGAQAQQKSSRNGQGMQVLLQKIYLRDASVEVPDAPRIFTGEWQPQMDVDLDTHVESLDEQSYQVTVTITVTAKQGEATAYIVEVQQAGVFQLSGFDDDDQRRQILGTYCPNALFAYAREAVSDFIARAGFPQFLLQPVNFDALYQQHLQTQGQPTQTRQ